MVKDLVLKARSYRNFESGYSISRETLESLVDVARFTSSGANKQPLKYYLSSDPETNKKVFSCTRWAGMLKDLKLPFEGNEPTAYIVICCDTDVVKNHSIYDIDVGIVAEAMMLAACEEGISGCMLGAIVAGEVSAALDLAPNLLPKLILALGKAAEDVVLTDIPESGNTAYYRKGNTHYVPKRSLEELIINK